MSSRRKAARKQKNEGKNGATAAALAPPPVYLQYTLRGYEDGQPFERTLAQLDRWAAQAAESLDVVISSIPYTDDDAQHEHGKKELAPPIRVTLRQSNSVFIGGQIWDTSFVLACWFYARVALGAIDIGGLHIAEVGAGIGLLSLALGALGAKVTATDLASVVPILQRNLDLNPAHAASVTAAALDWGDATAGAPPGSPFDLILACDCIYSEVSSSDLAVCLHRICAPGTVVWVVSEVRNESIQAAFAASIAPLFDIAFKDVDAEVLPLLPPELRSHSMRFYVLTRKDAPTETLKRPAWLL
ncbi:putative methyltransferase-domain-containing protein [Blastocladiella britannica]|nr:putative methyltransferase-domain-containing protein [Blastocladiella britannica]